MTELSDDIKGDIRMSLTITLKGIIDEDFVNYKVPSMALMFPRCSFKCGKEYCQNSSVANEKDITVGVKTICNRYFNNDITEAIVFQGLEPLDSFDDVIMLITYLRTGSDDDIVIYTGYNKNEIEEKIEQLKQFKNIIVKYGRFVPNQKEHFDEVLGVYLISDNQYAEKIS